VSLGIVRAAQLEDHPEILTQHPQALRNAKVTTGKSTNQTALITKQR
jgi:rRNA pseudouridine-1189 N-methylase Emg1 (Nep1/Mra1 family)